VAECSVNLARGVRRPPTRHGSRNHLCEFLYPLYIIPLIGVTHVLGGVGLLIPNMPRLTEWAYAGLVIDLSLAFYSHLNGGGSTWDKFDPIVVMVLVVASYVLRRCMRANRWSIVKNTIGRVAHPSFFLARTTAIVGGTATQPTHLRRSYFHQPERRLMGNVAFRVLAADNQPNIRTISDFRKIHLKTLEGGWVR
jgi:hypothetical protein